MSSTSPGPSKKASTSLVPLNQLRASTIASLSSNLDNRKLLLSRKTERLRDWRGLRPELSAAQVERISASMSPTATLFRLWTTATVQDLMDALEAMERYDVLEDAEALIQRDCDDFLNHVKDDVGIAKETQSILTAQDAERVREGLGLCDFDALVLHGHDDEEDVAFAQHLVQRMEAAGLKVFLPARDLQAGTVLHAASASIIQDRCRKVVTVLSPSFLRSRENTFLTDFAQYVGLTKSSHLIIPVLFKQCELPGQISQLMKLVYDPRPSHSAVNFYRRLLEKPFNLPKLPEDLTLYPEQFKPAINVDQSRNRKQVSKEGHGKAVKVPEKSLQTVSKSSKSKPKTKEEPIKEGASALDKQLEAMPEVPDHKLDSTDSLVSNKKSNNKNVSKMLKGLFKGDKKRKEQA